MSSISSGEIGVYRWWLIEDSGVFLGDVLSVTSELLINKSAAVVAFDSGPLTLSQQERDAGWTFHNGVAVTPLLGGADIEKLPTCDFTEYWVFDSITEPHGCIAYVNQVPSVLQPRPDDASTRRSEVRRAFWRQVDRLQPTTIVMEGASAAVITKEASFNPSHLQRLITRSSST